MGYCLYTQLLFYKIFGHPYLGEFAHHRFYRIKSLCSALVSNFKHVSISPCRARANKPIKSARSRHQNKHKFDLKHIHTARLPTQIWHILSTQFKIK